MPVEEAHKRKKSSRRKKTDSSVSRSGSTKHEPVLSAEPLTSDRPATVADLRKARLSFLETPPEERQRKMRYEYTKTVNVKQEVKKDSAREGSTVSRARSNEKRASRSERPRSERAEASDVGPSREDEADQYVYISSRDREPMPGAFASEIDREDRNERRKSSKSKSVRFVRPRTERRHTESVVVQTAPSPRASVVSTSRPELRRSRTSSSRRSRTISERSSTPVLPGSIHAIPDPAPIVVPPAPKRAGSILGSLFSSKPQPVKRKVPCLTCGDDVHTAKTATLPCSHRMCHPCLERIFKLAVTDPAHMPPRCCTEEAISLKHVDSLFDSDFKAVYNRKLKEYKTKNKIYCPARGCGEWVQPKYIKTDQGRKVGKCPACKTLVCGICSQKMHKARDCPKDPATKEFAETAKRAGWQKCYNCNAMVELKEGCNHMTCRCTAEFCMVCGLKWKSCDCPWFNYDQAGIGDLQGDPIRYQQEMDRRRAQEQMDEAVARRLAAGMQLNDQQLPLPPPPPPDMAWGWGAFGAPRRRHQQQDQPSPNVTPPRAMPGAWDDGPNQFLEPPQAGVRRYQRHHDDTFDPTAVEQMMVGEPTGRAGPGGINVARARGYRR